MSEAIVTAHRVRTLVDGFSRSPAYAGLADALRLAIGDGRVPYGAKLPSERDLTAALGVSRTTVTRAYATLVEGGYAEARVGAGTFAAVPGGLRRTRDRALSPGAPGQHDLDVVDLTCAATSAPPGLAAAYAAAAEELPAYLAGDGYYPAGLPVLQEAIAQRYAERGLPTEPDQIMVTAGALSANAIAAQALLRSGDRVLADAPVYPNSTEAFRRAGGRLVEVPLDDEWDLESIRMAARRHRPGVAYLIPDFQNPTGLVMSETTRAELGGLLAEQRVTPVVDEAHVELWLDSPVASTPFAAVSDAAVTLGSASKSFWGGLRLGWIRAPRQLMPALTSARLGLDLGAPVLEQLVLTELLRDPAPVLTAHRERLREQRDTLIAAVRGSLPDWRFRHPTGGLALWCELPLPRASLLAETAERHGVGIAPGPVFTAEGGLDRHVRLAWTRSPDQLRLAVERLVEAWSLVRDQDGAAPARPSRVMVA